MFQIFWFVYVQLEFVALLTYMHHSLIHTSSDYIVENDGEAAVPRPQPPFLLLVTVIIMCEPEFPSVPVGVP